MRPGVNPIKKFGSIKIYTISLKFLDGVILQLRDHNNAVVQGSQTQSVSRASCDWKHGIAGRIKNEEKIWVNAQCFKEK